MPSSHADAARKGMAVEHLVASTCILASNFELNALTALVDDEGVDLVFNRRGGSGALALQVKSRFWDAVPLSTQQQFLGNVRDETFRARSGLWMLFAAVKPIDAAVGPVWLVPSEHFQSHT